MKLWGLIFFIWLLVGGMCSVVNHDISGAYVGANQQETMTNSANLTQSTQQLANIGAIQVVLPGSKFWKSLYDATTMNFPYIAKNYPEFDKYILSPIRIIGIMSIVALMIGIFRGNISWG